MPEKKSDKSESNFAAIVEGFKNFAFPSEEMERIAIERADTCSRCDYFNPKHPLRKIMPDDSIEIISGAGCGQCGCFLPAKVRQMIQNCPEKKWVE